MTKIVLQYSGNHQKSTATNETPKQDKTIFKIVRNLVVFLLILAHLSLGMAWLGGSGPNLTFFLWVEKTKWNGSVALWSVCGMPQEIGSVSPDSELRR